MRRFFRLSGGGNDFLGFVASESDPDSDEIRAICRRGLSVGADGLFILDKRSDTIDMRYFNADGCQADLCLNGTRCALRLAEHLGWGSGSLTIQTGAGTFRGGSLAGGEVFVELPRPQTPQRVAVDLEGSTHEGWFLVVGVPHFVLPWPGTLGDAPVEALGAPLRRHPQWREAGANIDFVRFAEAHRLEIRTFERGVEAETLACGTGVMASVTAGLAAGGLELPVTALTLGGFELGVDSVDGDTWTLTGDARLVAEGTLHPGGLELPDPPHWT